MRHRSLAAAVFVLVAIAAAAAPNRGRAEMPDGPGGAAAILPLGGPPCPYDPACLDNPYGAGSPFRPDGLMNPYSPYGSPYSDRSWRNPHATHAPRLYDEAGNYRGRLSTNPFHPESVANPFGRYGSPFSGESINNPFGAGSPYGGGQIRVVPE